MHQKQLIVTNSHPLIELHEVTINERRLHRLNRTHHKRRLKSDSDESAGFSNINEQRKHLEYSIHQCRVECVVGGV